MSNASPLQAGPGPSRAGTVPLPDQHEALRPHGMPGTRVSMKQAAAQVEEYILSGQVQQIATINPELARNSLRDPYLHRILSECSMVLPDGGPALLASDLACAPPQERVTGVDLVWELARLSAEKGYGIYLLGSTEESSKAFLDVLAARCPGARIVGRAWPPTTLLQEINQEQIFANMQAASPQIVLVGFGNPRQEIWIHRNRNRFPPSVVIGIGGALDLITGDFHRAPSWMQRLHLDGFYRMLKQPRRSPLPVTLATDRRQPFERRGRGSLADVRDGVRVFTAPVEVCDRAGALILREAMAAVQAHQNLVIDMAATVRIEAEGIGGMLEARRVLLNAGLWIWLTNMSNPIRRVLQFSAVLDLFRLALTPEAAIEATNNALRQMSERELSSPVFAAESPVQVAAGTPATASSV